MGFLVAVALTPVSDSVRTATAEDAVVSAGPLRVKISEDPWHLSFTDQSGRTVLSEHPGTGTGPTGTLGFAAEGTWRHATRVVSAQRTKGGYIAELATTDPLGRRIEVRVARAAEGVIALDARVRGSATTLSALGMGFEARDGERYLGFGQRANAVDQRGNTVENYVSDGTYQPEERPFVAPLIPPPGFRGRDDATNFPIPWLLSTAGYGVLVGNAEPSYYRLGTDQPGGWSLEVTGAPSGESSDEPAPPPERLSVRIFAGPQPADVLNRFTRETGRQPQPAAPWYFGPWFQPSGSPEEQLGQVAELQQRDAPVSLAQTYLHYLPCGEHRARRDEERAMVAAFHDAGLAVTTYVNPMVCTSYEPLYSEAVQQGALTKNQLGEPYVYRYRTSSPFLVGQFDFSDSAGRAFFSRPLAEAYEDGHDGWMEDFGEYTPLDSFSANGMDGTEMHNLYPVHYHCAGYHFAHAQGRPLVRFQRSGWTGAARCAQVVWGGDPTTSWGFDGLGSALTQALSVGLSGISTWGSDIGGYFALGTNQLTPELLIRWIQFGAVSGVMRTQAEGIAVPPKARPQIYDEEILPFWRRYAKLRTQLYPYLVAADATYQKTGLPIMRHLVLAYPQDARAAARDDEFLFGPDLLVAPVLEPGARQRTLYLPKGAWVDLWRSVDYDDKTGRLELRGARVLEGRRSVTLPAPVSELPLLARAGTILPMLPADVGTLTDYGSAPDVVRLAQRSNELELLAFPRGHSSAHFFDGERVSSREYAGGWELSINGERPRSYRLQASLTMLAYPFTPCQVTLDGRPLPRTAWHYEHGALTVHFQTRAGRLNVTADCRP